MINNFLNLIILLPLYLILNSFYIPINIAWSLYETVHSGSFDNSSLFFISLFSLCLCYGFSELIAVTAIMPHVFVFGFCYLFLVSSLSLSLTLKFIDEPLFANIYKAHEESNKLILQNKEFITPNNLSQNNFNVGEKQVFKQGRD